MKKTNDTFSQEPEWFYSQLFKDYCDVFTIIEVCEILRISKKQTYRLIRTGQLEGFKVGREYRIPKTYLIDFIYRS